MNLDRTSLEQLSELAEIKLFQREPLELVKSGRLYIRTKSGEIKLFVPNFAQLIVLDLIERRLKENKPVRIRLLKARQLGFSTLFQAITYAFTSRREGFHSLVIADDEDGSKELFEMNKLYHERLGDLFKPQLKKSNEIALEFEGLKSRIDIDTSRNKNAGRGSTYQIVHKSESSRFQYAKEVNLGIANAVADLPGTMVFDETTANGMNFYYDEVQNSIKGLDGYDFVFIPWFMNPEYSMQFFEDFKITEEEIDIVSRAKEDFKIEITKEQLTWRRFAIVHKCGGDLDLFRQEYPSSVEEAFIFSGRPRFDVSILKRLKDKAINPIKQMGLLDLYEDIDKQAEYVIGVDTSEGLEIGDNSCATVLNCRNYSIAAHYSGKIPPDKLALHIREWGLAFNEALIVVESNNHGLVTLNYLKDIYQNIYWRKILDQITNDFTKKIGWQTSPRTKPLLIAGLDRALRSGLSIKSHQIIQELLTYVISEDGTTAAAEGKKDDAVISTALAVQGYNELPEIQKQKQKEIPTPYSLEAFDRRAQLIEQQREAKRPVW